ncbi:MAG: hypothetical protein ABI541_12840 [Betaproteobacteria bacterium]
MDTYSELVADTAPATGSTQPEPSLEDPPDPVDVARLTDLFVLEKALYEVRYELGSRPDRVRIPIAGLLERMQVAAAAL